jgi:PKD repeat protein
MPSFDRGTRVPKAGLARALVLALALCVTTAASASAAAPNWLEPADLSKPGRNASNPQVAMDSAGNTVAIWEREMATPGVNLQISSRPAGGAFTDPVDFTRIEGSPQLAITPAGEAVAVWRSLENPPGNHVIQVSTRPPGGSFSPPFTIHTRSPSVIPQEPRVAIGDRGDIVVTWSEFDPDSNFTEFPHVHCGNKPDPPNDPIPCPNPSFVMAAVRPAGGVFTEARQISPTPTTPPAADPELEEWAKDESVKAAGEGRPIIDGAGNATVLFSYFDGESNVVESTERPAGGEFSMPTQVSASGEDAGLAEIGVDAAGNAIASWARNDGADTIVQAATKAPGGAFVPLGNLSPAGKAAGGPALDVAPSGAAIVAWRLPGPAETFLQASTRPPGGPFSAPENLNSGKDNPLFQEVAVSAEGDAIVVWSGENVIDQIVRAAVRTAGASAFGAPVAISQSSPGLFHPRPSMDAGGDATVVWERSNGDHDIVQWAGYDADPPRLDQVSIPSTAKVADTVQFSASAFDVWPVGKPSFDFGDGGRASGDAVSHVYAAPGSYAVTVTVADAVGKTATSAGTILVKARNHFTIGKLKRNRKKGTATLTIGIPEPGAIVASGKGIKKATVRAAKGGSVKVPLKAVGGSLKRLKAKGKLKAKLRIAYSPVGGDTSIQRHSVTLQKKLG